MVYRRCLSLLGHEEAAHEAVQEIFLRLLTRWHRFRGDSSELTFIYSVATLHCLQQQRNRARHQDKLASFAKEQVPATEEEPDRKLALAALLDATDSELQQIVVLRFVDDMTVEQVAEMMGLSRKTVARKLQRFFAQARQALTIEEVSA